MALLPCPASPASCHFTQLSRSRVSTGNPCCLFPAKIWAAAATTSASSSSAPGLADHNDTAGDGKGFPQTAPLKVHAVAPVMKRGYGAFGGVTLEKSKLDLSQTTSKVSPQTADGGGGGDIGNKIFHGGGDGGDDGGDDDDYFGDFDDGDEGDEGGFLRRRLALPEVFDRKIVEAILQEWYKTMADLPSGLRQAMEMGIISSAQMVIFMSMNARPTISRLLSRAMPPAISRAFVGRMLADPAFLSRLLWEQAVTIGSAAFWEVKNRRERLKDEWDLALINVLSLSVCNAAIVWSLAPSRSYGSTFKFNLQNSIQKLPNNVFERSYLLREFDLQKRVQSFFYKAGELCLVGMLAGAAGGSLSNLVASRKSSVSVPLPSLKTNTLSYGAFLGLSGNLRYQLLYGAEKVMQQHFDHLGFVIFCSSSLRFLNIQIGDVTRLAWLGLGATPAFDTAAESQAYKRPSSNRESLANGWQSLKKSLFGGNKEENSENKPPKRSTRRKVKRKVMAAT